jgi:heptosyltransferase II
VTPARLIVLAPNWLGDAVMALPLIADIRRAWPGTEIGVAARRSVAPLFGMVPCVTRTVVLEGGGGVRALAVAARNAALLASGRFDAALLLPNSFNTALVTARAGIPERWGFARDLRSRLLTTAVPKPATYAHQADYYQALGAALGVAVGERFAAIDVAPAHTQAARMLLAENGVPADARVVVCAPGAAYGRAKQWLPERFAELAALLAEVSVTTVLVGAKADAAACAEVARLARERRSDTCVVDLAGRTDLGALAGLTALATAVVANDSGAMHLAAAAGARVVAIFGPTNDGRTSPLRARPDAPPPRVVATNVWCRPCMLRECPIDHRCMTGVSARDVFDALALK